MTSIPSQAAPPRRNKRLLRLIFLAAGTGLLVYLIQWVGTRELLGHARRLGWTFPVLVVLFGGLNFLRVLSWKLCLQEESRKLPLPYGIAVWLSGEAVSHLSFGWSGEAFRAAVLRDRIPLGRGLSALFTSRMAYFYGTLVVMAGGIAVAVFALPVSGVWLALLGAVALLLAFLLLLPFRGADLLGREFRPLHERLEGFPPQSFVGRLHGFYHTFMRNLEAVFVLDRATFRRLLAVNLTANLIGVVEVFLVLKVLVPTVTVPQALVIEVGTKMLGFFSLFVPGNVGVREMGIVLLLGLFHMAASMAVALALVRRARALFWVGVGSVLMMLLGFRPVGPSPGAVENESSL